MWVVFYGRLHFISFKSTVSILELKNVKYRSNSKAMKFVGAIWISSVKDAHPCYDVIRARIMWYLNISPSCAACSSSVEMKVAKTTLVGIATARLLRNEQHFQCLFSLSLEKLTIQFGKNLTEDSLRSPARER